MVEHRTRVVEIDLVILAIDSEDDEITRSACDYRQSYVYPYLEQQGFLVKSYQGKSARRHFVAPVARTPNIVYITGSGHGNPQEFTGNRGTPIFSVGNYSSEESEDKIIHFLSCETAAKLGLYLVNRGCRAFFGYDDYFFCVLEVSDVFWECDSEIDRAFAEGVTAEEVYDRTATLYQKRIQESWDRYMEAFY
jgi:hypothetical protein